MGGHNMLMFSLVSILLIVYNLLLGWDEIGRAIIIVFMLELS